MSYLFGDCQLDSSRRRLLRAGRPVPLQPKVFELLHFLVRHPARVVSKAVLLRALWPGTHVTTASLTRLVKEARRVVGDDGRHQQVIQTIRGFGYAFVAELQAWPDESTSESEQAIELAWTALEASLERGEIDLRTRVRDFAEACLGAVRVARSA